MKQSTETYRKEHERNRLRRHFNLPLPRRRGGHLRAGVAAVGTGVRTIAHPKASGAAGLRWNDGER